ncbi:Aromatic compound dioxygenase [Mycena venus]|uniref:Aromatic compound dioxygenase n=1 Tax=Mycena venus TaxID=2733690 RepID=A0A8H6XWA0_9AGAR|nr:Aromatic compound dioxygenase [Mycena venus]
MLNTTCVLSPETPSEDYIPNPPIRVDVTENQPGVPFTVDIGVLNIQTCQPLTNVMVEIWSPNAVGQYGTTFLRGATTTASNGIAEFKTIFPGYTSDSANHLNILVRSSSKSSNVAHFGRLFFTDPWTNIVGMYTNYNQNKNTRVKNADDPVFAAANKNGFNSIIDIESIGDDWANPEASCMSSHLVSTNSFHQGIVGYITVGVDPTKVVEKHSFLCNFWAARLPQNFFRLINEGIRVASRLSRVDVPLLVPPLF